MRNAVITAVFLVMMLFDGAVLQEDCIFKYLLRGQIFDLDK